MSNEKKNYDMVCNYNISFEANSIYNQNNCTIIIIMSGPIRLLIYLHLCYM